MEAGTAKGEAELRPGHGRIFAQRGARNSSEHRAFAADLYPADLCGLQDLEEARSREEEAHGSQPPCLAGAVLYSVLKPRPVERRCNPPFCGGSMWGRSRAVRILYRVPIPLDLRARARSPGLPQKRCLPQKSPGLPTTQHAHAHAHPTRYRDAAHRKCSLKPAFPCSAKRIEAFSSSRISFPERLHSVNTPLTKSASATAFGPSGVWTIFPFL